MINKRNKEVKERTWVFGTFINLGRVIFALERMETKVAK